MTIIHFIICCLYTFFSFFVFVSVSSSYLASFDSICGLNENFAKWRNNFTILRSSHNNSNYNRHSRSVGVNSLLFFPLPLSDGDCLSWDSLDFLSKMPPDHWFQFRLCITMHMKSASSVNVVACYYWLLPTQKKIFEKIKEMKKEHPRWIIWPQHPSVPNDCFSIWIRFDHNR